MPVLFLTLAAFIFFVLVIVALGVAHLAERREERHLWLQIPGKPFSVISVAQAFEQDSAILWETQVPALQAVSSCGPRGISLTRLRRIHTAAARVYPELYDGTSFEQWVTFLADAELVILTEGKVAITPQGLQFLKFRLVPKPAVAA